MVKKTGSRNKHAHFVSRFRAWPDINIIDKQWKGLEEPLFRLLLAKNVVHTEAKGGKWLAVSEALFQRRTDRDEHQLLLEVLLSVGVPALYQVMCCRLWMSMHQVKRKSRLL